MKNAGEARFNAAARCVEPALKPGRRSEAYTLKKYSVHPLFFLAGIAYFLTGKALPFIICTLSALLHECAHALYASSVGYKLNKIILMPYGAVVEGDIDGIGVKDEILLCLSGPVFNGATALLFVALWWFFPDSYPYTEDIVTVNAALAIVNLFPAFPLDGGRILRRALDYFNVKNASAICKGISGLFSLAFLSAFVFTCFHVVNFSFLAFAVLLFAGCFQKEKGRYEKIKLSYKGNFSRGAEIKRIAVDENFTIKKLLRFFSRDKYLIVDVYSSDGDFMRSFRQDEVAELFEKYGIYGSFKDFL